MRQRKESVPIETPLGVIRGRSLFLEATRFVLIDDNLGEVTIACVTSVDDGLFPGNDSDYPIRIMCSDVAFFQSVPFDYDTTISMAAVSELVDSDLLEKWEWPNNLKHYYVRTYLHVFEMLAGRIRIDLGEPRPAEYFKL